MRFSRIKLTTKPKFGGIKFCVQAKFKSFIYLIKGLIGAVKIDFTTNVPGFLPQNGFYTLSK